MLKQDAIRQFKTLSSGTLGTLLSAKTYEVIDKGLDDIIDFIENNDISNCENWIEIWNLNQSLK